MLDQFYADPSSWERLRLGPLGTYIDAFAQRLSSRGYARSAGRRKIQAVACFNRWLERRQCYAEDVDEEVVSAFLSQRRKGLHRREAPPALQMLLSQLRDAGIIRCAPGREESPLHAVEQCFARYLTQERGLAKPTIDNYLSIACTFLSERFGSKPIALDELTPRDTTGFIVCQVNRMSLRSAQLVTTALRSFFRFLYERGEIPTDLACSVPAVANWRFSDLPKFLEPQHVERLLTCCNRSCPTGRRDYAVLLLLARLGLRAGEVVHMQLDDLDWERGELLVRGKSLRHDRLPIPKDVGEALAGYLCHRPRCSSRRVFLRINAPLQGFIGSSSVCDIVRRALVRAGLHPARKGSHLLRHGLAVKMLRGGASLAEIGEILRHELPSTTEIYAKVDVAALRALALPWQGGEL
ncbi:MAG: tyrosine-type recombinase/integrase [Syntrophorhabdales bacterium]|jgi:site-specific recombinase XerD